MTDGQTEALMALAGYVDPDQLNAAVADGHHGSTGSPVIGEVAGGVSVDAVAGGEGLNVPRPSDHPALLSKSKWMNGYRNPIDPIGKLVQGQVGGDINPFPLPVSAVPSEEHWDKFGPVLGDVASGHHAVALHSEPGAPPPIGPHRLVNVWGKLFDESAIYIDSDRYGEACSELGWATSNDESAAGQYGVEQLFHDFVP